MYEKYILSKKDNTNIEIKTVITNANLLITAYSDLMLIKKHITETVYLESQIMKLKRENEELKQVTMMKCDLEKQLKHKNQLWKTAFKAYKNLKKIITALAGFGGEI